MLPGRGLGGGGGGRGEGGGEVLIYKAGRDLNNLYFNFGQIGVDSRCILSWQGFPGKGHMEVSRVM